jgi:enhancer of polycomb-like protein
MDDSEDENVSVDREDAERLSKLTERWRFDSDDVPMVGLQGAEEQDRMLVDEHDTKYAFV